MALVVSYVVEEPMRFYARVNPSMTASYQARLCAGRMQADIRDLTDTATVSSMTSTAFTFGDSGGNTVAFSLSGTDLQRNGDLIAQGVTALTFTYWKSDGTTAAAAADLHLVEYDFTVQIASQSHRVQGTAFPLSLTPGSSSSSSPPPPSSPLDEAASAATAARDSAKKATLDLVSISSSDVEIASFSLSGGSSTEDFHRLKLENDQLYHYHWSSLPLVDVAVNDGSASERTVAAGASPELLVEFRRNQSGTVTYTLDLTFTDAQTATITFTINWGGSSDDDDD